MAASLEIDCTLCGRPVRDDALNRNEFTACHSCKVGLQVTVFPAIVTQQRLGQQAEKLVIDDEASCFFHADKRAVVPCDVCGRFLCSLCDIPIADRHVCPACIQADAAKGQAAQTAMPTENERRTYGALAMLLAIIPLGGITQMISLYYCIRYWAKPTSVMQNTRLRYVLAAIISLLVLCVYVPMWRELTL